MIESVLEIEELKKEIFEEVDRLAPPTTPLVSNASTMPMSRFTQSIKHLERMLGLHFFGPVPLMGLVEVINGEKASTTTPQKANACPGAIKGRRKASSGYQIIIERTKRSSQPGRLPRVA